jgi:CRP-like cAMP-binding protein
MVCAHVPLADLTSFSNTIEDYSYGHDTEIFSAGKPMVAVFGIRSGALKMIRTGPEGSRIVRVLKQGDIAGLESAFSDRYQHTAVTVGEVEACRIPIGHFRSFVATHPELQVRLLAKSQATLHETESWLVQLAAPSASARARVARLLLCLRVDEGDRMLRFSIKEISNIIGIAPETASRVISDLVRQKLLTKHGGSVSARHFSGDISALTRIARET